MTYASDVLADSPVDFYQMETATGTDSGSGARTLTLAGGVTTGVPGIVGNGWSFDGVNDSTSMASFPGGASVANMTFEVWAKAPSNGGWSNDYQTFIRRNGTDIILIRGRGSNITGGVHPGEAEVYLAGSTIYSGTRIDDGNWHHIVLTVAGTAAKLYVDGTLAGSVTTSKSTYNFGTASAFIGSDAGTGEFYKGTLDNAAIYTTALSATRIGVHYNSAAPVSAGYTAQAMTATAAMPGGAKQKDNSYAASPMTASATFTGGSPAHSVSPAITDDTNTSASAPTTTFGSSVVLIAGGPGGNSNYRSYIKLPVTLGAGEAFVSGQLTLTRASFTSSADTLKLYRVTSTWDEATLTYNTAPTVTFVRNVSDPGGAAGSTITLDVSDVLSDTNYGLMIERTNQGNFASSEATDSLTRPAFTYLATSSPVDVSVSVTPMTATATVANASAQPGFGLTYAAQPMTATASTPNAGVSTTRGATVGAQAMTATATTIAPVVTTERFVSVGITAEPLYAFAETPGGGFAVPLVIAAGVLTASAEMTDATLTLTRGAVVSAGPMTASAAWIQADSVNGQPIIAAEGEDLYFQRLNAIGPKTWLRLNDKGVTAKDRVTNTAYGIYNSVQVGQFTAPENRHSVHFTGLGSYIDSNEGGTVTDEVNPAGPDALEFSFRTSKSNTFLMVGQDKVSNVSGPTVSDSPIELRLKDGKITLRKWGFGLPGSIVNEFTGFRNLADGNWHTVVVRSTEAGSEIANGGVEIWVDGTFEIRRYGRTGFIGFPDFIGGRPEVIEFGSTLPPLPGNEWFVGDMSEISFYNLSSLNKEIIPRNYYAFMGWKPFEAEPMVATAALADANGKGNQKRMLALYWSDEFDSLARGGTGNGKVNTDPLLAFTQGVTDYEGYKVFGMNVAAGWDQHVYRDEVTDEKRLIDLHTDINLNDYDVITLQDWPDEGDKIEFWERYAPGGREKLLKQLREANDLGVGLFVVQPRLAVDLGVVDRIEFVPTLRESKFNPSQGAAYGLYDYGSAAKFPWNMTASSGLTGSEMQGGTGVGDPMITDPTYLRGKAYYFGDTNKNDRFRVRALIDGLTTIPSYMIKDMVFHADYDQWGWSDQAFKFLHRMNGLQIGDEYIFHGSDMGMFGSLSDIFDYAASRQTGTFATPPGHVKAGTVVTTFGLTQWVEDQEVENPYKDYATTIVLQPGDSLGGRAVGGKIFVNFSEQPNLQPEAVAVQVIPEGNEGWPANYKPETAAQREWEWSFTRKTLKSTSGSLATGTLVITDPATGELVNVKITEHDKNQLIALRSSNLFPIIGFPTYQMIRRGLVWLKEAPEREAAGSVTIRPEPVVAVGSMPNPQVVAQRDNVVHAQTMSAVAQMPKVAEDISGDVEILTLPMLAAAEFTGYGKTIQAEPMTATAEFVENFDAVHTTGEQVVLTLHGYDATLYLKEEA